MSAKPLLLHKLFKFFCGTVFQDKGIQKGICPCFIILCVGNRCLWNEDRIRIELICAKGKSGAGIDADNSVILTYTDRVIGLHIVSLTIGAGILRCKYRICRCAIVVFPKAGIIVVKLNRVSQPETVLFGIRCTDDTHSIPVCVFFACKKTSGYTHSTRHES